MMTEKKGNPNYRLLAKDTYVLNDTHTTMLNNNDLIIGSSGRGKSTGYVSPNIDQHSGSIIVTDTKNDLYERHAKSLREDGYKVFRLDMVRGENSCKYNVLDFVRYDEKTEQANETDIVALTELLCPIEATDREPFWPQAAQMLLSAVIAFVFEALPREEHNMTSVCKMFGTVADKDAFELMIQELDAVNPESFAVQRYHRYIAVSAAEKTHSSIMMFVANAINGFDCRETRHVYEGKSSFDFSTFGKRKTALFINVSDTDRSCDRLVNILYMHAFNRLIEAADREKERRLSIPVRVIMDDFATGTVMPNFSKIISVIRSREISCSIILQNISQLKELYSEAEADTIVSNCDHLLFLGTTDVTTARYIGEKMNVPYHKILNLPLEAAYLFETGSEKGGMRVDKYRPDYFFMEASEVGSGKEKE